MSEYEGGTFRCKLCGKEFLTKYEGDSHYKDEHDEINTAPLLIVFAGVAVDNLLKRKLAK